MKAENKRERDLVNYWLDKFNSSTLLITDFKQQHNLIEPQFKEGELYVTEKGQYLVYNKNEDNVYGFGYYSNFIKSHEIFRANPTNPKQATPEQREQFKQMLFDEADKRGYKNGEFECLTNEDKDYDYKTDFDYYYLDGCNQLWIVSKDKAYRSLIMNEKGEWATVTPKEQTPIEKLGELVEKFSKDVNEIFGR